MVSMANMAELRRLESRTRARRCAAPFALGLLVLGGCGFEPDAAESSGCVSGQSIGCTCDDGTASFQRCGDDGAYEACVCEDSSSGTPPKGSSTGTGGNSEGGSAAGGTTATAG